MKHVKIITTLMMVLIMALSMTTTAFAKNIVVGGGEGAITISNAAKGETYKIYKLFDATITGTQDGSIAYQGEVPEELSTYFQKDEAGNIVSTEAAVNPGTKDMSDGLRSALDQWAKKNSPLKEIKADGTVLSFTQVPYGYYVVTTTQGQQAITVDSTNPNANIVDKNQMMPSDLKKEVKIDNETVEDVSIGDVVTYTVSFKTSNYDGAGADAKQIVSYTIHDTLPEFLSDVQVTKLIIDDDGNIKTTKDQTTLDSPLDFGDSSNDIILKWYDQDDEKFLYTNGATVFLTYTATITDQAVMDGQGNINTVTVTWNTYNPEDPEGDLNPEGEKLEATSTVYTYAIAFKKVDQNGKALAGAEFELPFYVKESEDGYYIYAGELEDEDSTNKVTTSCASQDDESEDNNDGLIVIKGVPLLGSDLESDDGTGYVIKETKAPDGYNKLPGDSTFTIVPQRTGAETTSKDIYLDENGEEVESELESVHTVKVELPISATVKVVVNKLGIELPETGDIGTTIFYAVGGVIALGGTLVLIIRKRSNFEK